METRTKAVATLRAMLPEDVDAILAMERAAFPRHPG